MNEYEKTKNYSFSFTGHMDGLFRIWIKDYLLSLLSLGFYAPRALLNVKMYLYSHTWLQHKNFVLHIKHGDLNLDKIAWLLLIVIFLILASLQYKTGLIIFAGLLLLALPFYITRRLNLYADSTSYDREKFEFTGSYKDSYLVFLLLPLAISGLTGILAYMVNLWLPYLELAIFLYPLLAIGAFFLFGFSIQKALLYIANSYHYNDENFRLDIEAEDIIASLMQTAVIVLLGIISVATIICGLLFFGGFFDMEVSRQEYYLSHPVTKSIGLFLGLAVLSLLIHAFFKASIANIMYKGASLGDIRFDSARKYGVFAGINLLYGAAALFSLGLLWPKLKLEQAKHLSAHTRVISGEDNV